MAKTRGFTNRSKKNIFIKITVLFLATCFLSTTSYAQIFTGKLLLLGNGYTVNFEEKSIQNFDAFSSTKPNDPLLLTEEVSNNLKVSFFKKLISEEFKVLKVNDASGYMFINGLIFKSDKNKNSEPRKKLGKPLFNTAPKKGLEFSSKKRLPKFIPMLVVFNL